MSDRPYLSVVIPVYNEEENLGPLISELADVLSGLGRTWEVICVDDGSTDRSGEILETIHRSTAGVHVIRFKKNYGQTAAFDAGFKAARGEVIVTMDADLQNDPHDIPLLLKKLQECDVVCGWRINRKDNALRKISSVIANSIRNIISSEEIRDISCSLKAFRADCAKRLKLFNGMHRFFPTLVKLEGGRVMEIKVNHRPRKYGTAKYNISNRLFKSFIDLLAVCWMKKRNLYYEIKEHQ